MNGFLLVVGLAGCPAQAIHFGDAADEAIASRRADGRAFEVLAEVGVGPRVAYLARERSRTPGSAAATPPHMETTRGQHVLDERRAISGGRGTGP